MNIARKGSSSFIQYGFSLHSGLPEPRTEIILHEWKPVTQFDFGFPAEQLFCLRDVGLPLSGVIGGVLNRGDYHIGIDELQRSYDSGLDQLGFMPMVCSPINNDQC